MIARPSARTPPGPGSPHACPPPGRLRRSATCASIARAACPLRLPVSQATVMPSGVSQPTSLRRCCSARISVGAISAHCQPASMAMAAAGATTVLPEPTSPCSRRCMGWVRAAEVGAISRPRGAARLGQREGSAASLELRVQAAGAARSAGARWRTARAWPSGCESCWASSSSNEDPLPGRVAVVFQRGVQLTSGAGWCRKLSASRSVGSRGARCRAAAARRDRTRSPARPRPCAGRPAAAARCRVDRRERTRQRARRRSPP